MQHHIWNAAGVPSLIAVIAARDGIPEGSVNIDKTFLEVVFGRIARLQCCRKLLQGEPNCIHVHAAQYTVRFALSRSQVKEYRAARVCRFAQAGLNV